MGNVIAILKLVGILLPMLVDLIKAVEAALPVAGQGRAKAQMVEDLLRGAFNTVQGISVSFEQVWPMLQPLIATIVAAYNASGIFKTVKPAPVPDVVAVAPAAEPTVVPAVSFYDAMPRGANPVDQHIVG